MSKFRDTLKIQIRAGHGGAGCVSFHREKYIPKGGPDGGDGGKGGDIYIKADVKYSNLSHLYSDRVYSAENGKHGMGMNRHGRDGKDLTIHVPPGTQIIDEMGNNILHDFLENEEKFLCATGGIGGKGNAFFKSATHQAPKFSQNGMPGEEKTLKLNLKLIADIGLVGLPNAGKSTLLSVLTNARPKIADYPFTTLIPNLGVVKRNDGSFYKIADIPGIIEDAHKGHGLGLSFLRHIERVKIILFLIEITQEEPEYVFKLLRSELEQYSPSLLKKPYFIILTKTDLIEEELLKKRIEELKDDNFLPISSETGFNLEKLYEVIDKILEENFVPKSNT